MTSATNPKKSYSTHDIAEIRSRLKLLCICGGIFVLLAPALTYAEFIPPQIGGVAMAICYVAIIYFGFLLAVKISGFGFGLLLALLTPIPVISLLPVIYVAIKAALVIKRVGVLTAPNVDALPQADISTNYSPEALRNIALNQKIIIFCILGHLVSPLTSQLPLESYPALNILVLLLLAGIYAAGVIGVFSLSRIIYGKGPGIGMGILTLIPLINLIAILKISDAATRALTQAGIPVGLLGTKWAACRK